MRAPFDGTVLSTSVEVGEGTTPGSPLLQLAAVSELHVEAEVDEADIGRISIGMEADISLDAFPGERFRGAVRVISPSVTRDARGGRGILTELSLPPDPRLLVGMSADVDIIVAVHEGVLWIPPNAVAGRGAERLVHVVSGGVAHTKPIDFGISTWEAVEVKSGLKEGDLVVASLASTKLSDGSKVDAKVVRPAGIK